MNQLELKETIASNICSYSVNADPVIAWDNDFKVLSIWKETYNYNQLTYQYASLLPASNFAYNIITQGPVYHTDANSINPTIYNDYYNNQINFHLAWEDSISSTNSKIYYERLYPYYDNITGKTNILFDNFTEVSYKSGYSGNYSPSITGVNGDDIKLVWIGSRENVAYGPGSQSLYTKKVLFKFKMNSYSWSNLYVYGDNVENVNINGAADTKYSFAWSQSTGSSFVNKYVSSNDNEIPATIITLSTTGRDIQVNNGATLNDMFANSFQSQSVPYSFSLSENLSGGLSKQTGLSIYKGREGVVVKDTAQFYFAVGDINLNGENIDFVDVDDTVDINNLQTLNNYLISQPFAVNDNSTLTYGVQYGITDSASSVVALSDGSTINFKVELVDNQTGEVIGLFDNVTYSQDNVFQYNNIGYQVDMTGIGNRTVRLKLLVNTDADCEYSLSKRYADEDMLGKSQRKKVKYQGSNAVTDYALEQNYPNPFNPSTKIKYQILRNGFVTLKVYDILGKEVATLVNKQQQSGRYEVNFNAENLASGVYLYRIKVNDYVNVKKMLLIK